MKARVSHSCWVLAALAGMLVSACAHSTLPSTPSLNQNSNSPESNQQGSVPALNSAQKLISNGGTLHSFADAQNLRLSSDADYERFIDPQVAGSDRQLLVQFMKIIPPGMRGDVYFIDSTGRVVANQATLESRIRLLAPKTPNHEVLVASVTAAKPMSYPPTQGAGGPFIRWYSSQGINAMYGYATFPCDALYSNGDAGLMYFNAYDSNGNDVVDNGLAQNFQGGGGSQEENAFVRIASSGPVYSGWTNEGQNYACGIPLGIMYGTLAAGGNYGEGYSFLGVGQAAYDPTQMAMPPSTTVWTNPAFVFYPTPSSLQTGSVSWEGSYTTNCSQCSVARMVTIAQNSSGDDGSCFGYCNHNGSPDARWDQVVAGNLISPCDTLVAPTYPFECTIEYVANWQGGSVVTSNNGEVTSEYTQQSGLEGIDTGLSGYSTLALPGGKFKSPLPAAPSTACTADSKAYCAVEMSSTEGTSCIIGYLGGYKPIIGHDMTTNYDVFKKVQMLELQETASESSHICEKTATTWSPNNPSAEYNDGALP